MTDCNPVPTICPPFIASSAAVGIFYNASVTLATTEACNISIDATSAVARFTLDNPDTPSSLGIKGIF